MAFDHNALGRIGGVATVDVIGTIAIADVIAKWMGWPPYKTIMYALILGEVIHLYAGIQTPVTTALTT